MALHAGTYIAARVAVAGGAVYAAVQFGVIKFRLSDALVAFVVVAIASVALLTFLAPAIIARMAEKSKK